MKVNEEHIIDASEKDANGNYDYYYEYDKYEFIFNNFTLIARSYIEKQEEASFFASLINEKREMVMEEQIHSLEMGKAIQHLQTKGKSKFSVLTENGYIPLVKKPPKPSLLKRLFGHA